ncbi:hypothetical protein CCGE531_26290 (plasmid) [Rhizobium sp. CCGE531]|nr:hypothetical protein CCGE531_26290 [Rhizobium sp. CCGE531]AYG75895.1 hypothetical protein CCGE532_25795 [Rhizobium sp. CCGE532]
MFDYLGSLCGWAAAPVVDVELLRQEAIRGAGKEILSTIFAVEPSRLFTVGVGEYFPIDGPKGERATNFG